MALADERDGALGKLAERADDLRVSGVADQHDMPAALVMRLRLAMDFGHQRTGGVDRIQAARLGVGGDGLRHAVSGEDHRRVAGRNLVQLLDEHGALGFQRVHDVFIMDDLVTDIDRGAVDFERGLHHVDGARHAGAEAARRAEDDAEFGLCGHRGLLGARLRQRGRGVSSGEARRRAGWEGVKLGSEDASSARFGPHPPILRGLTSSLPDRRIALAPRPTCFRSRCGLAPAIGLDDDNSRRLI